MITDNKLKLKEILKETKLFLLDLDGTIYLEDQLIEGAEQFIEKLIVTGKQYVFFTNNSSKSSSAYLKKIEKLGLPVTKENIFTSGQATALYLKQNNLANSVYLVGTKSLQEEFIKDGISLAHGDESDISAVVIGYDTELTYEKLETACALLDKGVPFIATNPDLVCPLKGGRSIPDCGAFCQMIEHATGRKPEYIGKPNKNMVTTIAQKMDIPLSEIVMIGDRLYTDVALGLNAGITALCTLTGETTVDDLKQSSIQPTFVIDSVNDLTFIL